MDRPLSAEMLRVSNSWNCLKIVKSDGRQTQFHCSHDGEYQCEELEVFYATEADVRNLIRTLQEIADKYYPVVPSVTVGGIKEK